ncbi:MAG: segregation/condensation protein A [Candidatus Aureabacteria bacterium]|nr:segregation/condensation protein A [Candidatus Auribacterota bacterium]MCK5655871.1 segregation/condensation protein A [Candidatus Auribacterota bacterium]
MTEDYNVHLEEFEGPLDLLLYLIKKDEVDIYDIPIEKITSQYLEYLELMKMLDLNVAGEFLVMASTLMYIKSMLLLPPEERPPEEDIDETDPRADLVRQLLEYKKFKELAEQLQKKERQREDVFTRVASVELKDEGSGDISDVGIFDLISAFSEVLNVAGEEDLKEIFEDRFTVTDKLSHITEILKNKKSVKFLDLFDPGSHKGEIVVTFLALLELIRLKSIKAIQKKPFDNIFIELVESI